MPASLVTSTTPPATGSLDPAALLQGLLNGVLSQFGS